MKIANFILHYRTLYPSIVSTMHHRRNCQNYWI